MEYLSTERYERREIGPDGDSEWGVGPDSTRPDGTVYMRTVNMPRIVFVGPAEQAAELFQPVD